MKAMISRILAAMARLATNSREAVVPDDDQKHERQRDDHGDLTLLDRLLAQQRVDLILGDRDSC